MKLLGSLAATLILMTCSCVIGGNGIGNGPRVEGSGVEKSEPRNVEAFTKLKLEGTPDVTINVAGPGAQREVVVSGDDNVVPLIETTVRNGMLVINAHENYNAKLKLKVAITVESLEAINSSGTGDIDATGVKAPAFKIDLSGTGDVKIAGAGDAIECSLSGTGDIDASGFTATNAKAKLSGTGDIKLNASDSLEAKVAGTGDIEYTGSPKSVSRKVTGTGKVHSK